MDFEKAARAMRRATRSLPERPSLKRTSGADNGGFEGSVLGGPKGALVKPLQMALAFLAGSALLIAWAGMHR